MKRIQRSCDRTFWITAESRTINWLLNNDKAIPDTALSLVAAATGHPDF
jgi:hypothetical protein